ncbi:MAG: hypothetical protein AB7O24_14980 [Kofleriaceae bacterium]
MRDSRPPDPSSATLEPLRFAEFLLERHLISDEQWLCALADHWSAPEHRRIGATIIDHGYLSVDAIEAEARVFHDDLDVVEIIDFPPADRPSETALGRSDTHPD